jgi:hypothetical protein
MESGGAGGRLAKKYDMKVKVIQGVWDVHEI